MNHHKKAASPLRRHRRRVQQSIRSSTGIQPWNSRCHCRHTKNSSSSATVSFISVSSMVGAIVTVLLRLQIVALLVPVVIEGSFVSSKRSTTTTSTTTTMKSSSSSSSVSSLFGISPQSRKTVTTTATAATTTTTTAASDTVDVVDTDRSVSLSNDTHESSLLLLHELLHQPIKNCAIIGVGVLGTLLLQQIVQTNYQYYIETCNNNINNTNTKDRDCLVVTGITKTTSHHASIVKQVVVQLQQQQQQSSNTGNPETTAMESFLHLRTNNNNNDIDIDDDDDDALPQRRKYDNIVFCAPPSGFDDYPRAIQHAMDTYWNQNNKGIFLYTSSGAVYGDIALRSPANTTTTGLYSVNEQTATAATADIAIPLPPRIQRLIQAEQMVLTAPNGYCIRLAGLYNLYRGPHKYWLTTKLSPPTTYFNNNNSNTTTTTTATTNVINSAPNGIVNLLHYSDAANACFHALQLLKRQPQPPATAQEQDSTDPTKTKRKILLISDGHPITRYQICQYATIASYYRNCTIPIFATTTTSDDTDTTDIVATTINGTTDDDGVGKIYDGSYSNHRLQWKPKYSSFQQCMNDHAAES